MVKIGWAKARAMTETEIRKMIQNFAQAASRAVEAGADAVEIMAGHGFLVSEFLSPFFNHRKDEGAVQRKINSGF